MTKGQRLPQAEDRPLMTVDEVAESGVFRQGRSALHVAVRRGEIPSVRVGGRVYIPTAALRRMLYLDDA